MPVIVVEAGKMDKGTKARLISELARRTSEIIGVPTQSIVTIIRENEPDNIGNGDRQLSDILAERGH